MDTSIDQRDRSMISTLYIEQSVQSTTGQWGDKKGEDCKEQMKGLITSKYEWK
jgi:hypothetical protein